MQGAKVSVDEFSILLICLTFVDRQNGTCFTSPFWCTEFWGGCWTSG